MRVRNGIPYKLSIEGFPHDFNPLESPLKFKPNPGAQQLMPVKEEQPPSHASSMSISSPQKNAFGSPKILPIPLQASKPPLVSVKRELAQTPDPSPRPQNPPLTIVLPYKLFLETVSPPIVSTTPYALRSSHLQK